MKTEEQKNYGGCSCKLIRYQFSGQPIIAYKCHCLDCQLASGGGAVAAIWVNTNDLVITGELNYHEVIADSGRKITRAFCGQCGTPILAKLSIPNVNGIFAMSLDNPDIFFPEYEIWTCRTRRWEILNPTSLCFDQGFPSAIIRKHLAANSLKTK
ncbi:MAG: GFA family protein [Methylococcales bacterium]|nr:GFA family protein [Methylococcales bacterium]